MSTNPFLRRVLGEAGGPELEPGKPDESPPAQPEADLPPAPADDDAADTAVDSPAPLARNVSAQQNILAQDLARMWQAGQEMDVATQLMFTPASYVDFVDVCYLIGQEAGQRLGRLLDELADSENVPVPEPSADYASVLQRVAASREDRTMVPAV